MLKLIVIALMMFGLYVGLLQFFPSLFATGYVFPGLKVSVTYATTVLVVALALGFRYVTVK